MGTQNDQICLMLACKEYACVSKDVVLAPGWATPGLPSLHMRLLRQLKIPDMTLCIHCQMYYPDGGPYWKDQGVDKDEIEMWLNTDGNEYGGLSSVLHHCPGAVAVANAEGDMDFIKRWREAKVEKYRIKESLRLGVPFATVPNPWKPTPVVAKRWDTMPASHLGRKMQQEQWRQRAEKQATQQAIQQASRDRQRAEAQAIELQALAEEPARKKMKIEDEEDNQQNGRHDHGLFITLQGETWFGYPKHQVRLSQSVPDALLAPDGFRWDVMTPGWLVKIPGIEHPAQQTSSNTTLGLQTTLSSRKRAHKNFQHDVYGEWPLSSPKDFDMRANDYHPTLGSSSDAGVGDNHQWIEIPNDADLTAAEGLMDLHYQPATKM